MSVNLFEFKKNYYSLNGEDGIIERLLSMIGIENGYLVEFGAWDGIHWSNTYRLIEQGWSGCLIEGDIRKYRALCKNIPDDRILKLNTYVTASGPDSLDEIFQKHNIGQVDVLSVDIDSDDLRIWEGLSSCSPTIVIIEYNPTIPFDTRYVNPPGSFHGNSALSIYESAIRRSYSLVEGTDTNLIFVKTEVREAHGISEKTLQEIHDQTFQLRYFFSQDGTLLHNYDILAKIGVTELFPVPWTFTFSPQPVLRIFRKRSEKINILAIVFSFLTAMLCCPLQLFKLIKYFLSNIFANRSPAEVYKLLRNREKLTRVLKGE